MPKRKREVEDSEFSDDAIEESPKKLKGLLPENEAVLHKKKKKKNKQKSPDTTNAEMTKDISPENEESLSLSPKKKKKKNKLQAADIPDEEVMSENEESVLLSPNKRKKKKKNKRQSAAEKEPNSSSLESDKEHETSMSKPSKPTAQKKASLSKGFVLFVGQIPHNMKQKDVEKHFATIGGVKDVRLLIYPDSQRSRGCAYVEFVDNAHRKLALKLNGSSLGHSKIKVEYPYQGSKRYGAAKKNNSKGNN